MEEPIHTRIANIEVTRGLRETILTFSGTSDAISNEDHLLWMIEQIEKHGHYWPLDKIGRWVGFIQGCLVSKGLMSIESERDRTREIYRSAYAKDGIFIPETINRV